METLLITLAPLAFVYALVTEIENRYLHARIRSLLDWQMEDAL